MTQLSCMINIQHSIFFYFYNVRQKSLSGVLYLRASASLPLAVGQEAGEEWQVDAVVQRQEEVFCQLEARGILGPELPNTVQEEQEDWSLEGGAEGGKPVNNKENNRGMV